jgi:hypothetical protein
MRVDTNGFAHCILALGENYDNGILINSEGYDYARYYSLIPSARLLVMLKRYPAFALFIEKWLRQPSYFVYSAKASRERQRRIYFQVRYTFLR